MWKLWPFESLLSSYLLSTKSKPQYLSIRFKSQIIQANINYMQISAIYAVLWMIWATGCVFTMNISTLIFLACIFAKSGRVFLICHPNQRLWLIAHLQTKILNHGFFSLMNSGFFWSYESGSLNKTASHLNLSCYYFIYFKNGASNKGTEWKQTSYM